MFHVQNNTIFFNKVFKCSVQIKSNNDIKFICSDINQISLKEILDYEINNNLNVDCIVCIQLLAYLSNWKTIVGEFSFISKYILINLDFPDNPIGFVKSKVELTEIISKYYDIIEDIDFVNKFMSILFCKSKNYRSK